MRLKYFADGRTQIAEVLLVEQTDENEVHIYLATGKCIRLRDCWPLDVIDEFYKVGYYDIVKSCLGGWAQYVWVPDKN